MAALVMKVRDAEDHPTRPANSVILLHGDKQVVAQKVDGRPRYEPGSLMILVEDGGLVPESILRAHYWNEAEGKGELRGSKGNRVKAGNFAGVRSDGIHLAVTPDGEGGGTIEHEGKVLQVKEGDDVSDFLGIVQWEG